MKYANILAKAVTAYNKYVIKNTNYKIVVNFTLPSNRKRLNLYDKDWNFIAEYLVAHGAGSGAPNTAYAIKFSNVSGSRCSSLGSMVTGEVYYGKHGRSLKLRGLDKGVNDNVYSRHIVIHSSNYVTDKYVGKMGRCGQSWGCLAVDPAVCNDLIDKLKGGAFVYVYGEPAA